MSTTTEQTPAQFRPTNQRRPIEHSKNGSLTHRLTAIKNRSSRVTDFIVDAALEIAETFDSFFAMIEFETSGRTIVREFVKDDIDGDPLIAIAANLAIETQLHGMPHTQVFEKYLIMTCPMIQSDSKTSHGAFSLFVANRNPDLQKKLLDSFQRTVQWMVEASVGIESSSQKESPEIQRLATLQKASNFENLTHLCFGLVNSFCEKLGCEKVAIGLLKNNGLQLQLKAISGLDTLQKNSPCIIQIQQAQDECLDTSTPVLVNIQDEVSRDCTPRYLIHQQWHQESAGSSVASVPIHDGDNIIGVLSLQRNANDPFTMTELEKVADAVSKFAPAIQLTKRADRSLRCHFVEDCAQRLSQKLRRSLAMRSFAAVLAFTVFGWLPYQPTVMCTLEPANMSRLVAPFDGVLKSVQFLPGEEVSAGDVVLQFDTRQLELEQDRLGSQIKSKCVQRDLALVKGETAAATVADAEIDALNVQLASTRRKIAQASLRSRLDGQVVRGDLRSDIGQAIPRGTALAEIAPMGNMKLILQIPETHSTLIAVGQTGYFAAKAQPSEHCKFEIVRITPSTEIADGKNVVTAEAVVASDSEWMRPGLKGYAKIDTGWSPVIWIVGHRIFDSLRLGFWI